MKKITLIKCDDGSISVSADEGQINTKSTFDTITDENEQFMIALADFLGYEPAHLLDFEGLMDYFEDYYDERNNATYTAFLYEELGIITADLSTYDSAEEAISFAKTRDWDEVVNDLTGDVIWRRGD